MQVYNSVTGLVVSDFGNERQGVKEAPLTSQKISVLNSTSVATSCLAKCFFYVTARWWIRTTVLDLTSTPNCSWKVQRQWPWIHSNARYPDKFKQKRFLPSSLPSLRPPQHVSSYQLVVTLHVLTTHIRLAVLVNASVVPNRDKGCSVTRLVLRLCQWLPPKVLIATHYRLRTLP
jgi:hypothetical protein